MLEPASDEPSCVDVSKSELSRMDAAVPEGTVVGESGVSDGDSAGEAAAPNPVSMHLVEPELESD